jgi:hypothetical protein
VRLPARYAPVLFGLLLSGLMSFLVTGIATLKALGPAPGFVREWLASWGFAWPVAFATVLAVAPLARRVVAAITEPAGR